MGVETTIPDQFWDTCIRLCCWYVADLWKRWIWNEQNCHQFLGEAVVSTGVPTKSETHWDFDRSSFLCVPIFYVPVLIALAYQEGKMMNWCKCNWKWRKHATSIVSGSLSLAISSAGWPRMGEMQGSHLLLYGQDVWPEEALGFSMSINLFCWRDFNLSFFQNSYKLKFNKKDSSTKKMRGQWELCRWQLFHIPL